MEHSQKTGSLPVPQPGLSVWVMHHLLIFTFSYDWKRSATHFRDPPYCILPALIQKKAEITSIIGVCLNHCGII